MKNALILVCIAIFATHFTSASAANCGPLEEGQDAQRQGEYEIAIDLFTEAIRLDPKNAEAYKLRADAYQWQREYELAIADADEAIRLDPKNSWHYTLRGGTYLRVGNYDKAIADFGKAIELDPGGSKAKSFSLRMRASCYESKMEYDKAIVDYTEVVRFASDDVKVLALHGRAKVYHLKSEYDKSIMDYTEYISLVPETLAMASTYQEPELAIAFWGRALRVGPPDVRMYIERADAYKKIGLLDRANTDYDSAIVLLNQNIMKDPKNAVTYFLRGNAYDGKGDIEKAVADYNEAARLDPKYANAYMVRGQLAYQHGDYEGAISRLTSAIRFDPNSAEAYTIRAYLYRIVDNDGQAITDYEDAIRLDPGNANTHAARGVLYTLKGEYDKAVKDFDRAIQLKPDRPGFVYDARGVALARKGEYDKSISDYLEAIRLDPKNISAYTNLAWLLATCPESKVRDGPQAIKYATKASELSPESDRRWNVQLLSTLAAAHAEAGKFDEAVQWQKKAIRAILDHSEHSLSVARKFLELFREGKPFREELTQPISWPRF